MAITDFETLSQATDRLEASGYKSGFKAVEGGLFSKDCGEAHAPESLRIDEIDRFEGTTDPAAEEILFALTCPTHGTRGTYTPAYGPLVEMLDAEMITRLHIHHKRQKTGQNLVAENITP